MRIKKISMGQIGRVLERLQGRKPSRRPEAAVSEQLRQPKVSPGMAHLFWEAIETVAPSTQHPAHAVAGSQDLAEAVRLLTKCTPEQLAKVIGFINGILASQ